MAWKWYNITSYKAEVGGSDYYYGNVQLFGNNFYALLQFHKNGPLPNATAPIVNNQQRFYGHLDYQQIQMFVDLLRNEKPLNFGWYDANPTDFQLMTGAEAVGEGDGILAATTS
ncbi:hypothetical protein L0128_22845 [candidate division KSB1 bacterium]|nr:hypothetical protein [candidate division KSB1 bacterium]